MIVLRIGAATKQSASTLRMSPGDMEEFSSVPSLIPVSVDRRGCKDRLTGRLQTHRGSRELLTVELFVFLAAADQHGQEQNKHQNTEQYLVRIPDVYLRRQRIAITLLCLFDAVSNTSQEFSSLLDVELIF